MKRLIVFVALLAAGLFVLGVFHTQAQSPDPTAPVISKLYLPNLYMPNPNPDIYSATVSQVCNAVPVKHDLIAGQHYDAGDIEFWMDQQYLYVKYTVTGTWCLDETHVHVATTVDGIPQHNGNPTPGLFAYFTEHDPCVKTFTYQIPLMGEWDEGDTLIVATHAEVHDTASHQEETAWGFCYDFSGKNWARYCTFYIPKETVEPFEFTVGYEDLPIELSDFDYNDLVVEVQGAMTYCKTGPDPEGLAKVEYDIVPQARGATWDNRFNILFPADTFLSDGVSSLSILDENQQEVGNPAPQPFNASLDNDFAMFMGSEAFPLVASNTIEFRPGEPVTTKRTASLTITFDSYQPFDLSLYPLDDPANIHGNMLYLDPWLYVIPPTSGPEAIDVAPYDVHAGSDKFLLVPFLDWKYPEEQRQIWTVYVPGVTAPPLPPPYTAPTFAPSWWTAFNDCVYNGVACPLP